MRYKYEDFHGDTIILDTKELDYKAIWGEIGLKKAQIGPADRIISLYNSDDFFEEILIVTSNSWMKPYNREFNLHQADNYKTRNEIEIAAKDNDVVSQLIDERVLELHKRLRKYVRCHRDKKNKIISHPQASYRLDPWRLYELQGDLDN